MSRQIALQTLSEALRRTKRVLNARQGMEGAKTLTEGFRRSGAPIPLTRGFQVARNRVSPLQSPFARHWQLFSWLVVVDRRCYSDGGLGFSPDGFRLRSRRCRNRGSSDVLGDYRAKVANDVNDVILRRLPYPASHRTDMRQKSNAG